VLCAEVWLDRAQVRIRLAIGVASAYLGHRRSASEVTADGRWTMRRRGAICGLFGYGVVAGIAAVLRALRRAA
jgi:hypothetical protein